MASSINILKESIARKSLTEVIDDFLCAELPGIFKEAFIEISKELNSTDPPDSEDTVQENDQTLSQEEVQEVQDSAVLDDILGHIDPHDSAVDSDLARRGKNIAMLRHFSKK